MILGCWHKPEEANLSQLRAEGFKGILIRADWIFGDTMKTYLGRMIEMYEEAKKLGFEFFLIDYCQGMGQLNNNYNYKVVADYFKSLPNVCFYIGEPYEEYVERQEEAEFDVIKALDKKIKYVNGNVFIDSTKRNSTWIQACFHAYVKYIAISSYWRQQTEWSKTNAIWISGQLGYHNLSSWRYKSLAKKAKGKRIAFLYQFNPSNWSSDGWENKLFDLVFSKKLRIKLEASRRKKFIEAFRGI